MSPAPRWGNTGLLLGVVTALGVWVIQQAGWLAAWDGMFYDRLHALTARWRNPQPKVLLVRLEREDELTGANALKTVDILESLGAKVVAFNFIPQRPPRDFFQLTASLGNVLFGRELKPVANNPDALRLESWPPEARDFDLPWGVVFLPASNQGVHREQQTWVAVGTNRYPTLEAQAALLAEPLLQSPTANGKFLVNFGGGPGRIPNIALIRVLAGELVPEMVKGKIVLVGKGDNYLGLETPITGRADRISFLEFQGNVLQTLLDATPLRSISARTCLLILLALGVVSALLYQRMSSVAGLRFFVAVILACAAGAAVAMAVYQVWISLGVVVVAQAGQFAFTLVLKVRVANLALNDMRLRALKQIKQRFSPPDTELTPEHWDQLVTMIQQTLDVERMVFFERIPGTPQLRERRAFNCAFEDVQEKARKLDAPAFAELLTKGSPVRSPGFFAPRQSPEEEFLCPLVFAAEVYGVWGVTIDSAKAASFPQLEAALSKFSQQIARRMFHNKQAAGRRTLPVRLRNWFSAAKEDRTYQELRSTADLLEQYYDVLEGVFSQIGSATVVYDFFGRVLKANEVSETLLRPENLSPAKANALEFLRLVTGRDDAEIRRLLRGVLLDRSPASMPVSLPSQRDRHFLLRVYPLADQKQPHSVPEPPGVRGMVCELIETTSLATLASLKGVVADRLGVELRDHLAAIALSASLLETEDLPPTERQMMADVIRQKTDVCAQVISVCQKYLGRDVDVHSANCYPVDALSILQEVLTKTSGKAAERRVELKTHQPRLMAQVFASSVELNRLFSAIIEILLMDAAENTAVSIIIEDSRSASTFRFFNCGFGIPNPRLQEMLASPESPTSEPLDVLRKAARWVSGWGGSLEVNSDVGKGYSISLQLRQFQLVSSGAPTSSVDNHFPPSVGGSSSVPSHSSA